VSGWLERAPRIALGVLVCAGAASCGGDNLGASTGPSTGPVPAANNVVSVSVSSGPNDDSINVLYTTVTVCLPGTSTCQTIDNVQVDTGSYGLRLLAPVLTLTFPVATTGSGAALLECTSFVDGYSWGPVVLADVQVSGESASSVPVQIIGDSRYPTVPANCSSSAPTSEDTVATFGANGIIGIGPFAQDCGSFCASSIPDPAVYYACTTEADCTATTVPVANQVPNPVTLFTTDNNGTIISLSAVPTAGAASVSGSLIFGIDTESNNASGTETVIPIATSGADAGYLTTIFNGQTLTNSFIDSGSNGYFFNDTSITQCTQSGFEYFYCPSGTVSLTGEMQPTSGTATINFTVGDAEQINAAYFAYPALGGTNPAADSFDWGLPFFFGQRVATAIEGYTTSVGTGPYIAF